MGAIGKRFSTPLVASAALAALASTVTAQGAPEDEETIVVTATRRATNIQETPLAVTAITGQAVERSRIQSIEDTLLLTPNATFLTGTGTSGSYASVRGTLTADDAPGVDLPVTFFIDDVFYGSAAAAYPDYYDVSQVEVLRGPQGTTFGRNVTGGAIVVRSREPEHEFGASLSATIGNDSRYEARGHVTGSLGESVAGRLAFSARDYGGYQQNVFNGNREGGQEFYSGRGMLSFDLGPATKALISVSHTIDKSPGVGYDFIITGNGPAAPAFEGILLPTDPDISAGNITPRGDRKATAVIGRVQHDFSFAALTSITAWRRLESSYLQEPDGTALNIHAQRDTQDEDQFSQELRLTSLTDGPLEWIAGVYFLKQDSRRIENYTQDAVAGTQLGSFRGIVLAPGLPPLLPADGHIDQLLTQDIETTSLAAYAEGVYHFDDHWALRAGIRYTWEEKTGRTQHAGDPNIIITFPVAYDVRYEEDWQAWTPRVILEYRPTEDLFFYAGASRGFKSGGFTLNPLTAAEAAKPYAPEYTWNYEVGMRSQWFGRAVTLNVTLFQQETVDLQTRAFDGSVGAFRFINAGKTRSRGVEVELAARPSDNFDVGVVYGYIDAIYDEFRGCTAAGADCSGNKFPVVPEHTVSAYADAHFDLGGDAGSIFMRGEVQYRSEFQFDATNTTPSAVVDKTGINGLVNAQIGWESADGDWRATLWGKNLTDERYVTGSVNLSVYHLSGAEQAAGESIWRSAYNQGLTYGFTLSRQF